MVSWLAGGTLVVVVMLTFGGAQNKQIILNRGMT